MATGSSEQAEMAFSVSPQQRRFFDTFGFIRFPGLFASDIAEITEAFDEVVATTGRAEAPVPPPADLDAYRDAFDNRSRVEIYEHVHFGQKRVIIPSVLDKHPRLKALQDDPRISAVMAALVGPDAEILGSDGNLFDCDTSWHFDSFLAPLDQRFVKIFFYLDPVDGDRGGLRVIPGSHHNGSSFVETLRRDLINWEEIEACFGVQPDAIPSASVVSEPGDLLVTYYRVMHATFHGGNGRRLFTINTRGSG